MLMLNAHFRLPEQHAPAAELVNTPQDFVTLLAGMLTTGGTFKTCKDSVIVAGAGCSASISTPYGTAPPPVENDLGLNLGRHDIAPSWPELIARSVHEFVETPGLGNMDLLNSFVADHVPVPMLLANNRTQDACNALDRATVYACASNHVAGRNLVRLLIQRVLSR